MVSAILLPACFASAAFLEMLLVVALCSSTAHAMAVEKLSI
jgi:hypothetical protein